MVSCRRQSRARRMANRQNTPEQTALGEMAEPRTQKPGRPIHVRASHRTSSSAASLNQCAVIAAQSVRDVPSTATEYRSVKTFDQYPQRRFARSLSPSLCAAPTYASITRRPPSVASPRAESPTSAACGEVAAVTTLVMTSDTWSTSDPHPEKSRPGQTQSHE